MLNYFMCFQILLSLHVNSVVVKNRLLCRTRWSVLSWGCGPSRYVFDGKPPELKSHELEKRAEKRSEAEKELAAAQEKGEINKVFSFILTTSTK